MIIDSHAHLHPSQADFADWDFDGTEDALRHQQRILYAYHRPQAVTASGAWRMKRFEATTRESVSGLPLSNSCKSVPDFNCSPTRLPNSTGKREPFSGQALTQSGRVLVALAGIRSASTR